MRRRMIRSIQWNASLIKGAAVASLALLFSAAMVRVVTPNASEARDFFRDYSSARNLVSGKPVYGSQEQLLQEYLGPLPHVETVYNGHPPTSVLLALPFVWTDYVHATQLWGWLSLGALGLSLAIFLSEMKWSLTIEQWMLVLMGLTFWPPLWLHIGYGQFGLVILLLITLAWRAARTGRDAYAGCLIGLAAAIKIFPAFLFLYFILRRRWRAASFVALSFILVNAVTLAIVGVRAYRDYLAIGLPHLSRFIAHDRNSSLTGFFSRLFSPPLSSWMILISSIVILAVIVRAATGRHADFDREFGLTVTGTLLLCSLTWDHSFVILLLPLGICAARYSYADARSQYLLIGSWILMALPVPLLPGFNAGPSTLRSLGILSINFYGLLAFFIAESRFHAVTPEVHDQTSDQMYARELR